jgi:ectoine hydroxylase-related dioxygenase (phytanoyl-CoA dioxygenase family)
VLHGMCIHGAPGNCQKHASRRAVATTWVGDDAVYVERPGEMEPDFSDRGLKPGDPLDEPAFPRVFERG